MSQRAGVRGFTLTEIAIVIGIMGVFLSAVWTAASNVYSSHKAQQATSQITQLVNGYRTLYSQHNVDVAGDVTCTGVNAGLFPSEMITAATTGFCSTAAANTKITPTTIAPQTPWGGISYVLITASQAPPSIRIYYKNLTAAQCIYLANIITFAPNVIWEKIDAASQWLAVGGGGPPYPAPYSNSDINTYCSEKTTTNSVGVMYKVK
jgi:prepilin-type N-terminal cleavage/methylation domain-containing protein